MRPGPLRRHHRAVARELRRGAAGGCGVRGCAGPGGALGGAGRPGRPCHRGRGHRRGAVRPGARGGSDGGAQEPADLGQGGHRGRHRGGGRGGHRPGREGRRQQGISRPKGGARAERACAGGGQTARRAGHSPPAGPPSVGHAVPYPGPYRSAPVQVAFFFELWIPRDPWSSRPRRPPTIPGAPPGRRSRSTARPTIPMKSRSLLRPIPARWRRSPCSFRRWRKR